MSAWIAAPAAGATFATAYVEVDNPTMYEIFVVSATADGVAGKVELRGAAAAGAEPPVVNEFPVPSYGSTSAAVGAPHLRLLNLAKPLKPGDTVPLTLTTEGRHRPQSVGERARPVAPAPSCPREHVRMMKKLAWWYTAGFLGIFIICHTPGLTDAEGRLARALPHRPDRRHRAPAVGPGRGLHRLAGAAVDRHLLRGDRRALQPRCAGRHDDEPRPARPEPLPPGTGRAPISASPTGPSTRRTSCWRRSPCGSASPSRGRARPAVAR